MVCKRLLFFHYEVLGVPWDLKSLACGTIWVGVVITDGEEILWGSWCDVSHWWEAFRLVSGVLVSWVMVVMVQASWVLTGVFIVLIFWSLVVVAPVEEVTSLDYG